MKELVLAFTQEGYYVTKIQTINYQLSKDKNAMYKTVDLHYLLQKKYILGKCIFLCQHTSATYAHLNNETFTIIILWAYSMFFM